MIVCLLIIGAILLMMALLFVYQIERKIRSPGSSPQETAHILVHDYKFGMRAKKRRSDMETGSFR